MRTSVVIPDEIVAEVRGLAGGGSFSRFVRESVEYRLREMKREALVREMEAGYCEEAQNPSLDPEWADIETERMA